MILSWNLLDYLISQSREIVSCRYLLFQTGLTHFSNSRSKAAAIIYSSHKEKDLSHYPAEAQDKSMWDLSPCLIYGQLLFLLFLSAFALSLNHFMSSALDSGLLSHPLPALKKSSSMCLLFVDHYHEGLSDGWWSVVQQMHLSGSWQLQSKTWMAGTGAITVLIDTQGTSREKVTTVRGQLQ